MEAVCPKIPTGSQNLRPVPGGSVVGTRAVASRKTLPTLYYDRAGKPIELETWARHHADLAYRTVGEDVVGDVTIRTLWHGHDTDLRGPPIRELFGTARIDSLGGIKELETYSTEKAAVAGHHRHVVIAKRKQAARD